MGNRLGDLFLSFQKKGFMPIEILGAFFLVKGYSFIWRYA